MIKINNLSIKYENKELFKNADFEIQNDKITVIAGLNGVGKTTLLKIMAGTYKTKDAVITNDFKEIFFLPQKIRYPEGISLFDYIVSSFFKNSFKWYISIEEKNQVEKTLRELELYDRKDVMVENLSSGELQKANIAMALVSNAECLLLDEPTSNMDLINQIKILDILKKLTLKNITSVIIMHDLNMSASYGDNFIGLGNNLTIVQADKQKFFTGDNLEKIFGIKFEVVKNDENFHVQIFN